MKKTPERVAEVKQLRAEGWSDTKIAKKMGVHPRTIWAWRNPAFLIRQNQLRREEKHDWEMASKCPQCGKAKSRRAALCRDCREASYEEITDGRIQRFIEMRRAGLNNRQIGEKVGLHRISVATVFTRAREKGYDVPAAKRGRPRK